MPDPIRQVHLLFEEHFGSNMREWPDKAVELKKALATYVAQVTGSSRAFGRSEGIGDALRRLDAVVTELKEDQTTLTRVWEDAAKETGE